MIRMDLWLFVRAEQSILVWFGLHENMKSKGVYMALHIRTRFHSTEYMRISELFSRLFFFSFWTIASELRNLIDDSATLKLANCQTQLDTRTESRKWNSFFNKFNFVLPSHINENVWWICRFFLPLCPSFSSWVFQWETDKYYTGHNASI